MHYDSKAGEIVLSTGTRLKSYGDDLSIQRDYGDGWQILYGSDGGISEESIESLTDAERAELADEMIARWTAWKGAANDS